MEHDEDMDRAATALLSRMTITTLVSTGKELAAALGTSDVGGLRYLKAACEFELQRKMQSADCLLRGAAEEPARNSGLPAETGRAARYLLAMDAEQVVTVCGHFRLASCRDLETAAFGILKARFEQAETILRRIEPETSTECAVRLGAEFDDAWRSHWEGNANAK